MNLVRFRFLVTGVASFILSLFLAGCFRMPEINTAAGLSYEQASDELARMARDPKAVKRHIVVLNGYHGLPTLANRIARKTRAATGADSHDVLSMSYMFSTDLDSLARSVVRQVDEAWPSADPSETVEVDVIGISMGGLVARWAALPPANRVRDGAAPPKSPDGKRLKIARLFTLGTPHLGAIAADSIALDSAARDMRTGSPFLKALDANPPDYEIIPYAQLRDHLSGATRCAPPGCVPIWTSGTWFFSHLETADNPVFLADIAHRLRGEPHLEPGQAPPRD